MFRSIIRLETVLVLELKTILTLELKTMLALRLKTTLALDPMAIQAPHTHTVDRRIP